MGGSQGVITEAQFYQFILSALQPQQPFGRSFKELMREAAERGLITAVEPWIEYRYQRNMTAHVYDEEKARRVYESAQSFIGNPDGKSAGEVS